MHCIQAYISLDAVFEPPTRAGDLPDLSDEDEYM
jgi:hypothetical protein